MARSTVWEWKMSPENFPELWHNMLFWLLIWVCSMLVKASVCIHGQGTNQSESEIRHVGSGFWLSSISLPDACQPSHGTEWYLYKAPTSSHCFDKVHIMRCWTKIFPTVNKTDPCQDFLALSDCRATAEGSLSPFSAWAPSSRFLTPPFGPFNVVWEIFQNMAALSCLLAVKLLSEAELKKQAAVSLHYLTL